MKTFFSGYNGLILLFLGISNANNTIETIPKLVGNVFAYGFDNLTLRGRFQKMDYTQCVWVVKDKENRDLGVDSLVIIFNKNIKCGNALPCHGENFDGSTIVITELIISKPITYNLDVYIICNKNTNVFSWHGISKSKCFFILCNRLIIALDCSCLKK